jgi:hypothetical protein
LVLGASFSVEDFHPAMVKTLAVPHTERYLQFNNIDMQGGKPISAQCSLCERTFIGNPNPGERTDDVLIRMRADFELHICKDTSR